jgi:hypothetical protein
MESLTSILNLTVSLISLAAVTMGLNLLNDYKSKVQPRLDNEEYLMELLKSEVGREKLAELHKADWSATTQFSTVRRFVTNKRNKS